MRQYSADRVTLSWQGLDLSRDLAAGSFLRARAMEATWTAKKNGLGGAVRFYHPGQGGELEIIVGALTRSHQNLLALATADRLTRAIRGPLVMIDNNTGERIVWTAAYIVTTPDEARATAALDAVWTFAYTEVRRKPVSGAKPFVGDNEVA